MERTLPSHPLRTRFGAKKEIVCEFMPPAVNSNKVLILCTGMPGYPGGSGKAIRTLAKRGYWVFVPRYRGSWESDGKFLDVSPHEDVLEVVWGLENPFTELTTGERYQVKKAKVYILGASFGGAAALLASRDPKVVKAVALAPVVDWGEQKDTDEPLDGAEAQMRSAWGNAYRGDKGIWKKLLSGTFYNPVSEKDSMIGKKVLILHAKDDTVVPVEPARMFAEYVGAKFVALRSGGHFGTSSALKPHLWRRIDAFIRAR